MNNFILKVLLLAFAFGTFASASVLNSPENLDRLRHSDKKSAFIDFQTTEHQLDFVVNVDRKVYYADNVGYYNWTGARESCRSAGMQLASITTEREKKALERSYNINSFTGSYWTSARDALEARQFTWDTTDSPGEEVGGLRWLNSAYSYKTCGRYMSLGNSEYTESYILVWDCSLVMRGTLCEVIP